jgi:hypothetical protein
MSCQRQPFRVTYSHAPDVYPTTLRLGTDFSLESESIARYFMEELSPSLSDLLRISMAIFVVDRRVRRNQASRRSWKRDVKLKIEVSASISPTDQRRNGPWRQ